VVTRAPFPVKATAPTCYGPGVAALATYLLGRQHLPVERAAECLEGAFGAAVSTGWLSSLLPTAAARLDGFLAIAREQLAAAQVAHFDETGGRGRRPVALDPRRRARAWFSVSQWTTMSSA